MRQNPERRAALLDAAIRVLAGQGMRGLTLRAVDAEAGVPTGTASNYFSNRGRLLEQVTTRTRERLTPDPALVDETMRIPPGRELLDVLLHQLVDRMRADPDSHLAMLELRLEATRRPELAAVLTETFRAELADTTEFHVGTGMPGGRMAVVLMYLTMSGYFLDTLTTPDVLAEHPLDDVIRELVHRMIPDDADGGGGTGAPVA
ncbi:TetR family transcriptional regulator [Stackebrandtia albiflava]|uniref:TetR family transcriptional regulator n=1 Tax=Stackebrandtia albiflava TaxID=406432 RepID=A0A562VEK6_9ACTN|nr:TetR/AcrR family transcriptional regulator [Stackebrandtia albiflava]TWJ16319.1 TetR family transcriptional regulator [Stackebrandtia albiflava]